jgi:hypothetical protein
MTYVMCEEGAIYRIRLRSRNVAVCSFVSLFSFSIMVVSSELVTIFGGKKYGGLGAQKRRRVEVRTPRTRFEYNSLNPKKKDCRLTKVMHSTRKRTAADVAQA